MTKKVVLGSTVGVALVLVLAAALHGVPFPGAHGLTTKLRGEGDPK